MTRTELLRNDGAALFFGYPICKIIIKRPEYLYKRAYIKGIGYIN